MEMALVPATREAEKGGPLEPKSPRPALGSLEGLVEKAGCGGQIQPIFYVVCRLENLSDLQGVICAFSAGGDCQALLQQSKQGVTSTGVRIC